ncbi:small multi-drug export protein [Candidatus Woesearchaeota archaeon]|nr:small multi-drug export protein [Candidatus Woesearchaeota archaeon]
MLREFLELIFITFLPFLELRASIPYGILKLQMNWIDVFIICVITNVLLGIFIFFLLDKFVHLIIKIKPIGRFYHKIVERTQKRIHKSVEKYGEFGVALFIGVPLPGSGVYSGALGAYLLGMSYRDFIKATIIGVMIAGTAVTLISLFAVESMGFLLKMI